MSLYVVRELDRSLRAASGDLAPETPGGLIYESALPSTYMLSQLGIVTESAASTLRVQSGEIIQQSAKGDRYTVTVPVLTPSEGVRYEEVVQVDVGSGAGALQTVVQSVADASGEYLYEGQPASESVQQVIVSDPQIIEAYVLPAPETVAIDEVNFYIPEAPVYATTAPLDPYGVFTDGSSYVEPVVEPASLTQEQIDSLSAQFGWTT